MTRKKNPWGKYIKIHKKYPLVVYNHSNKAQQPKADLQLITDVYHIMLLLISYIILD